MAKIRDLPNNAESYHRKGLNAIQEKEYAKAVENFKKSFAIDHNIESFEEIIEIYLTFDKRKSLQKLWHKNFPDLDSFYQDEKILSLWVQSLEMIYPLQTAINKLSQEILFLQTKEANTTYHQESLKKLLERLAFIQTILELDNNEYQDFIETIYSKNAFSFLEMLKTLYIYQDSSLNPFFLTILRIPKIENFIKADVLHYLLKSHYADEIEYVWFDQTEHFSMEALTCYKYQELYKDTLHQIDKYFAKNDPHFRDLAIHQFNLQALVFYPFLDRVIDHPKDWLKVFLNHYGLSSKGDLNPLTEKYFSQANEELQHLFS